MSAAIKGATGQGRRGFVGVDHNSEVFSVSKWTKKRVKEVREKFGTPQDLPNVDQAHQIAAQRITDRLREIQAEKQEEEQFRLQKRAEAIQRQSQMQNAARQKLQEQQRTRQQEEASEREARLRSGIKGLIDRLIAALAHAMFKKAWEMQ